MNSTASQIPVNQKCYSSPLLKPSDVVDPIRMITNGVPVIPLCRVSGDSQKETGNLQDQDKSIRKALLSKEITILESILHTGKGNNVDWLRKAVEQAVRIGAWLVAESMCRLMRPARFYTHHQFNAEYTQKELRMFDELFDGTAVFTLVHPDATSSEIRGIQSMRGKTEKDRIIGRPHKTRKSFRERWFDTVLNMNSDGYSLREIAEVVSKRSNNYLSHISVRRWIMGI